MRQIVFNLLDIALEIGIQEKDFWDMTIAEVLRVRAAFVRKIERERKDKAYLDYIQAQLIGVSIGSLLSKGAEFPTLHQAYPELFADDTSQPQDKTKISAQRFIQFANQFNSKFKEVKTE